MRVNGEVGGKKMIDYKIKFEGKELEKNDEQNLVCFLKMLDFSAEYLHKIYEPDQFRFSPEEKTIYIYTTSKHSAEIDEVSKTYGFQIKNQ